MAKNKKEINKHEQALANRIGGTRQPGSGSIDAHKGDVVAGDFLIDDKYTSRKSQSVSKVQLQKITKEARELGKEPVLSLSFDSMGLSCNTWYLIPEDVFIERCLGDEENG